MTKAEQIDYLEMLLSNLPQTTIQQHIDAAEKAAREQGPVFESLALTSEELKAIARSDEEFAQGQGISFDDVIKDIEHVLTPEK